MDARSWWLLLGAILPLLGLLLLGTIDRFQSSLRQAERRIESQRDQVVAAFSSRIGAADSLLRSMAESLSGGADRCGEAFPGRPPDDVEVTLICTNDVLAGSPVGSAGMAAGILLTPELRRRLAGSAQPQMLLGPSGRLALVSPLPAQGRYLLARIAAPRLPDGLLGWLLDASGRAVPLSGASAQFAAGPPPAGPISGAAQFHRADGVIAARAALSAMASLVVARQSAPILHTARLEALQRFGLISALLGASALALLLAMRHAVLGPVARLRQAVTRWRSGKGEFRIGGSGALPDSLRDLADAFQDGAAALAMRERELQAAIERADLLAAEVHHRVKNNLQIVSSLLALQAQRVTEGQARAEFEAARDRIGALATLHRHMYAHHDPEAIDLGAFIAELGLQLFASIGEKPGVRIKMEVEAPALRISSDQAVPLALIITEAVSAALKQGFPPGRRGRIAIRVTAEESRATLAIEDDGVAQRQDDQLRALLLRGLARQLGAELRRQPSGLALDFPLRPATSRPPPVLRPKAPPPAPQEPSGPV